MGFQELAAADVDFILGGDFAATGGIEYQSVTAAGAQAWKAISHVIVVQGDPESPLDIGTVSRRGRDPIIVSIPKDATLGIAEVHPREDRIKLHPGTTEETIYLVKTILDAGDPVMWRIHAVP
jgi:hypothetical protein